MSTESPTSGVNPNQINYFSTIQLPINFNQEGFNPVYGPFPPYEFALNPGQGQYSYLWILVVASIGAFALAAANGANDVANSFATSVGSKSLKMWHAIIIASLCEFGGAALLGSRVTATIRSGITSPKAFINHEDLLMFGMMVAVIVVAAWVFLATYLEMPVSITHSIIGAIVGFALCSQSGASSVRWDSVGLVVASWFVSPALSGIISYVLFSLVRALILRRKDAFNRALYFFPVIVFITVWVNAVFIIFKGGIATVTGGKGSGVASGASLSVGAGFGIATGVAAAAALVVGVISVISLRRNVGAMTEDMARQVAREHNIVDAAESEDKATTFDDKYAATKDEESAISGNETGTNHNPELAAVVIERPNEAPSGISPTSSTSVEYSFIDRVFHQKQIDDAARANTRVEVIHAKAEVFNVKVELAFSYLQIFTACFASFAHGSNDVANSVGPLAAVVSIYEGGPGALTYALTNNDKVGVPDWVLFLGCSGLVVGLALYGHIIIAAMGMKYAKITPSRGFCAEISFAFVVVLGSFLGIPLSTTQCIVGAILGIGLTEARRDAVNWRILGKTLFGWVITLVICALFSALLFSYAVYAPSMIYPMSQANCLAFYGGNRPVNSTLYPHTFSTPQNTSNGDPASYVLNVQDGTIIGLYGYPSTGQVLRVGQQANQ